MKIKIPSRRLNSVYIIYYIILLFELSTFFLIPHTGILVQLNGNGNKYMILILTILEAFLLYRYSGRFFKQNKKFFLYFCYMMFALILVSIFSMVKYNESIIDTFTCWHSYLLILLVIPLYYICECEGSINFLCNSIITMSIIYCLLIIVQGVIYNKFHILFLPGYLNEYISYRHGNIRMATNSIDLLAFIFLSAKLFVNNAASFKTKLWCIVGICIELTAQLFFYQTRSWQIIFIAILVLMYIISSKNKKFVRVAFVVLVVCFVLQFLDIMSFVESFSTNSKAGTGLSTVNRLSAIEYFWNIIKSNPIFGNGFIRAGRSDLRSILYGVNETFYYSDLGVYGLLAESGVIGLFIFLLPFLWIMKMSRKINMMNGYTKYEQSIVYGILLMWVFTSVNLALTNSSRFILIPFSLTIIGFISKSNAKTIKYRGNSNE